MKPILQSATTALQSGSAEVINSHDQYEVFNDPRAVGRTSVHVCYVAYCSTVSFEVRPDAFVLEVCFFFTVTFRRLIVLDCSKDHFVSAALAAL